MIGFRIVGTFAEGCAVQHVLLVHPRHGPRALACQFPYEATQFFHVDHHDDAPSALAADNSGKVTCAGCRQTLERDYVFDPSKPRTLIGQLACDLRDKTEDELDELLARSEKRSAVWSAVHLERYRRETGLEY